MRLYDGESVEGFNSVDVEELKKEYPNEGMNGIDPVILLTEFLPLLSEKKYLQLMR